MMNTGHAEHTTTQQSPHFYRSKCSVKSNKEGHNMNAQVLLTTPSRLTFTQLTLLLASRPLRRAYNARWNVALQAKPVT